MALNAEELAKRKARYEELYAKEESQLTEAEAEELLKLAGEVEQGPAKEEKSAGEEKPKGEEKPPEEKKKLAGIYETEDALIEGILNSETERKRIAEEAKKDPELAKMLEGAYKGSQREVTKLVQEKKKGALKPIHERRLMEVSKEEYNAWHGKDPMAAQEWLNKATALNEKQAESGRKVFKKYPAFHAMLHGAVEKSKEFETFDRICVEHPEWETAPNGAELAMEAMEKELGLGKAEEPPEGGKPKPVKKEEKPGGLAAGKAAAGGGGSGKKRLSPDEFAALSDAEQREYLEGQRPSD